MAADVARRYRFGAFEFDARTGELRRRGVRVRLGGRPAALLEQLLQRPGALVTRDELRTALWGSDTFVDFDHGLNSAMNRLREALRDPAERSRIIETLPRRGYRFLASVELVGEATNEEAPAAGAGEAEPTVVGPGRPDEVPAPAVLPGSGRRWPGWQAGALLALAGLAIVLAAGAWHWRRPAPALPPTEAAMLVVLPFANLGGPGAGDLVADGITDELISQIGALDPHRLGVIARTTSMQYRGSDKSVMDIAEELGVEYLLEGTLRRDGARVRITARLVDVATQTQRWAESYERPLDDLLMLQRDIAMQVASSLAGGALSEVLSRGRPATVAPYAVYEQVLRARALRQQATEQSAWQCVATFEDVIRQEPAYAPAYAGLADCYRLLGAPGWEAGPPADLMARARAAVTRALALDPQQPEAYAVRGMVTFAVDWDTAAAEGDLRRAIALNPSYARAHQYLSSVLTTQGRLAEAVTAARKAVELDPLSANENTTLGVRLYYAGQYRAAVDQFARTLRRTPDLQVAHWGLAMTYRELGRHADAVAELRRAVALSGQSAYMRAWLAHQLAVSGQRAEATTIRDALEREAAQRFVSPFLFALMASGLAEREAALLWLERTADARSGWMPFLAVEPELAWLRADARFRALAGRVRHQSRPTR